MAWIDDHRYRGRDRAQNKWYTSFDERRNVALVSVLDHAIEQIENGEGMVNDPKAPAAHEVNLFEASHFDLDDLQFVVTEDGQEMDWPDDEHQIVDVLIAVPVKYEVCPTCEGKGKHVNPSIDDRGITESEMYELGEDFREEYFGGRFDVTCYECDGLRVTLAPDLDNCKPAVKAFIEGREESAERAAAEEAEDRRIRWYESGCPE